MKHDDMTARLRFRDLQLLCMIARSRSLSATAMEARTTQPALSRWLKEVESMFGTQLFDRDRAAGMRPTDIGQVILNRAASVLAEVAVMSSEVDAFAAGVGGHLRLGVIPFVSGALVSALLVELTGPTASLSVSMSDGSTDHLLDELRSRKLDAIVARVSPHASADLQIEPLFVQKASLVFNEANRLATRPVKDISDLEGANWILPPPQSPTRLAINRAFLEVGLALPLPVIETASTRTIYDMLRHSADLLGIVPSEIGRDFRRLGGVHETRFPGAMKMPSVALIYSLDRRELPQIRLLRDTLRRIVAGGIPLA
ncbi:LysR family transcriptional regulator [Paracidovorax citrulli]